MKIDEELLKFSVGNAYNEGQKDGIRQGKLAMIRSLKATMVKMKVLVVNYEIIEMMENHLEKE